MENVTVRILGEGVATRGPYNPKAGIAASTLYDQLKRFFVECPKALEMSDKKAAARIAQASTHWLRHIFGSHAVAAHTPLEVVQSMLGHASLNTTTIYVKAAQAAVPGDEPLLGRADGRARPTAGGSRVVQGAWGRVCGDDELLRRRTDPGEADF